MSKLQIPVKVEQQGSNELVVLLHELPPYIETRQGLVWLTLGTCILEDEEVEDKVLTWQACYTGTEYAIPSLHAYGVTPEEALRNLRDNVHLWEIMRS